MWSVHDVALVMRDPCEANVASVLPATIDYQNVKKENSSKKKTSSFVTVGSSWLIFRCVFPSAAQFYKEN